MASSPNSTAFRKSTIPLTAGSPSLLPNNLSASDSAVAYIRLNGVHVQYLSSGASTKASSRRVQIAAKGVISQVAFVTCRGDTLLVITSSSGVQIWTADGTSMLSFIDPMQQSTSSTATSPSGSFLRGISYFGDTILVGDSAGCIHAIGDATGQKRFRVLVRMETVEWAISCIATDNQYVIAATEGGDVAYFLCTAFQTGSTERVKGVISGFGFSATACCAKNGFAVVAYSTGSMRVYSLEQMKSGTIELIADIAAHSRCINGIALNSFCSRYLVATCSEDHIVRVWDLQNVLDCISSPRTGRTEVRIAFEEKCDSTIFTGICFVSSESVVAASYDDDFISVFSV